MKFGFCAPNYGDTATREILIESTERAEELGYDSVWLTDHVLMPGGSGTPYENIFESMTTLAFLAGLTSKIKLGISSLVLPLRNPIVAAKQIANVDVLSRGRAMLCMSAGWSEREYRYLASNFGDRGKRLDDSIRLLRALWSGERRFVGESIPQKFDEALLSPRMIQERIPIWIGGLSDRAMRRAAHLGDAWHPNAHPLEEFKKMVGRFREIKGAEEKDICVRICFNSNLDETQFVDSESKERVSFCSKRHANAELIEEFENLGVRYVVIVPAALPFSAGEIFDPESDRVVRDLERFAELSM